MPDRPSPHLTAAEAAAILGVSVPTLYAYVSRGLLASEAVPGASRARRYRRDDVERLLGRRDLRRHPERAATGALTYGEPVLPSALTLIDGGQLYYRGRDAVVLSRERSFEQVAALLWTGDETATAALAAEARGVDTAPLLARLRGARLQPVERLQAALPWAGAADAAAWDLRPDAVARCGARVLAVAAAAVAGRPLHREGIAATLVAAWKLRHREAAAAISAALVLAADHELNVSTFVARCAASAAATPWDCVAAGLATLKGRRHGGEAFRMEALLRDAAAADAHTAVGDWLRRGERLPGFGHPLYRGGDPRAQELLRLARRVAGRAGKPLQTIEALLDAVREVTGDAPNLDVGLAAVATALALPRGAALALFALGRCAGWVAHALEEYDRGTLIRPRARYVGSAPATAPPPGDAAR